MNLGKEQFMKKRLWRFLALLPPAVLFLITIGCAGTHVMVGDYPEHHESYYENRGRDGGPPPWAPAHGYRAKHKYRYYPSAQVYYDTDRSTYFYFSNGKWQVSTKLPGQIHMSMGHNVILEMDTNKPYRYHSEVIKRYPPGHAKNQGKGKSRGYSK
jgi:hypothetical protein